MTFSRTVSRGGGKLAYRLRIEGAELEFVTDAEMAQTMGDGRRRVTGLKRKGIRWTEKPDFVRGKLTVEGFTANITDIKGKSRALFTALPTKRTYLKSSLPRSANSVEVQSSAGWSVGDYLYIGTETMKVSAVPDSTHIEVTAGRAQWSSYEQAHYATDGANYGSAEVTDKIVTFEGRRVWLYAYGEGDDPQGNGTQIFLGKCATDARIERDSTWEITIKSIADALKQDIGGDLQGAVVPRGIYYPWSAPLILVLSESNSSDIAGSTGNGPVTIRVVKFFETQQLFVDYLNGLIAAETSGWGGTYKASVTDIGWRLEVNVGASAKAPRAFVVSTVDEPLTDSAIDQLATYTGGLGDWIPIESVSANQTVVKEFRAPVPRGTYGTPESMRRYADPSKASEFPDLRIYLGGTVAPSSVNDAFAVKWPGAEGTRQQSMDLARGPGYNAVDRWVELRNFVGSSGDRRFVSAYGGDAGLPEIKLTRSFATGSLADFIDGIIALSPDGKNLGAVPDLRSGDVNLTEIREAVAEAAAGDPFLLRRVYTTGAPKKLEDALAAEVLLLGCFLATDSLGRLTVRRMYVPTAGNVATVSIGSSRIVNNRGFPTWEREALGTLNLVRLKTGYDATEDRYRGRMAQIRNVAGFSANTNPRAVDITPVFAADGETETSATAAALRAATPLFAVFGGAYAMAQANVSLRCFYARCGDVVLVTSPQVPNEDTGDRGISDKPCLVTQRTFNGETGAITMGLLYQFGRFRGYAPAMRISAASNVVSNTWDLVLDPAPPSGGSVNYVPDESPNADRWFGDGDAIRIIQWDATTPTTKSGSVDSVSGMNMRVTLTSSWGGLGSDEYTLGFDVASTTGVTVSQKKFAWMAGADLRIAFTDAEPAHVLGP